MWDLLISKAPVIIKSSFGAEQNEALLINWEVTEGMQLLLCFKNHFWRITMQKESRLLALHSYKHCLNFPTPPNPQCPQKGIHLLRITDTWQVDTERNAWCKHRLNVRLYSNILTSFWHAFKGFQNVLSATFHKPVNKGLGAT